jgi:hypothetical protein
MTESANLAQPGTTRFAPNSSPRNELRSSRAPTAATALCAKPVDPRARENSNPLHPPALRQRYWFRVGRPPSPRGRDEMRNAKSSLSRARNATIPTDARDIPTPTPRQPPAHRPRFPDRSRPSSPRLHLVILLPQVLAVLNRCPAFEPPSPCKPSRHARASARRRSQPGVCC